MSEVRYNVDFSGRIIPGWDLDEVKANVAKLLKADEDTVYKLFSGKRFVIKKNVDHQTALKINNILKDAGADCVISPTQNGSATAPPPLPAQSESVQPVDAPRDATGHPAATQPTAGAKPSLNAAEIRPQRFWYMVALLLFLGPMIAGGMTIFNTITTHFSGGTRLIVPGETAIQVKQTGTYVIYYETSAHTQFNFAHYQLGRDFEIALMDLSTGEELNWRPSAFGGSENYGSVVRVAIAEVQFDTVGFYNSEIYGEIPETDSLLIRRFDLAGIIKGVVWTFGLFFLGFIAGPVMALAVLIKRQNYKRKQLGATLTEEEENKWAMFAHNGTLSTMFVPLGNFLAPIIIWQLKKNESEFVVDQAKEALNFQITLIIYMLISFLLVFIFIGFFLIFGLVIFNLIIVIVAGVKANNGEFYRYPMCLRLITQKRYPSRAPIE